MTSQAAEAVTQWVDRGLNQSDPHVYDDYFSAGFRDHDPLNLPGLVRPTRSDWGTVEDLRSLAKFLASPLADFAFVVEDVLTSDDKAGYRIFGEGSIALVGDPCIRTVAGSVLGNPFRVGASESPEKLRQETRGLLPQGAVVGDRLYFQFRRVGMLRFFQGLIVENWGPWQCV